VAFFADSAGAVLYRIAYGRTRERIERCRKACRLVEDLAAMRAMIRADLGLGDEEEDQAAAIVGQAVEDAMEGREVRW
jgi:hypothetical protein